tara:strand:- start:6426 stop:6554 length:129 start_codon:yes stop_codon:yes gene_type:complete
MKDSLNPQDLKEKQPLKAGLYVKEDDQDWGSGGMNDIQEESE